MSDTIDKHPLRHTMAVTAGPLSIESQFPVVVPPTDDPAWQPPIDPASQPGARTRALVINREVPIVTVQTAWDIAAIRRAIEGMVAGLFDESAQLTDAIVGDSRVQSALASRCGGLLGRPIEFDMAPGGKACLDAWKRVWPTIGTEAALGDFLRKTPLMGFQHGQLLWDTSDDALWIPHLHPWHSRYTYYHWTLRKHIAITLDGQVPIIQGNGHWVSHQPHGSYRGWMHGAMRAIAPWWIARNYALRDWARYSERHGMPILLAITPWGALPEETGAFVNAVATLGQESAMKLPQSNDDSFGKYDLKLLEASDQAWLAFAGLVTQCNSEITLALLGQNLTSEVKEGSFSAAQVHADVRQDILESDARALENTIYMQIARPFAEINFGDANLAPRTRWCVTPVERSTIATTALVQFAQAISALYSSGMQVDNIDDLAASMQLNLKISRAVEPKDKVKL